MTTKEKLGLILANITLFVIVLIPMLQPVTFNF